MKKLFLIVGVSFCLAACCNKADRTLAKDPCGMNKADMNALDCK